MVQQSAVTILNVDDDAVQRGTVTRILERAGFAVQEAASGTDALQRMADHPGLVILDGNLPDIDGLELCRRIKATSATSAIPVLHLSPETFAGAEEAGADAYLRQPVEPAELIANVKALLRARQAEEERDRLLEREREMRQELENTLVGLRQSEMELRRSNQRKDEFLALLGHELRNPLGPISNAMQVLRLRGDDAATRQWTHEVVERQLGHLTRLVDDLLDASRISQGKVLLRKEPLDVVRLVRATVEDQRSALESGGLTVELILPAEALWVEGDPTRLAQVLDNLLLNALKFTDAGGRVTVTVGAEQGERAGVAVTVRDTGIGIPAEVLPHIFERYAQVEESRERSRDGLGLGLALVKGLIELHGGVVRAASAGPGQGAGFTFWLPCVPAQTAAPARTDRRSLRVLLIEDNQDAARSLQLLVEMYGHDVQAAHTGPEGVAAAQRGRPEVVLCDLGLPEMDGLAVARALRQDSATAGAYLVAMSGYGSETDQQLCREAGFDLHLTKPVDPTDLKRLLANLAAKR